MLIAALISFLIAGACVGILSATFGLGGGLIIVPLMYYFLKSQDLAPQDILMHLSAGTSLAVMIVTALTTAYSHIRKQNVVWPVVKVTSPYITLGVFIGVGLSYVLYGDLLRWLFVAFLLYVIGDGLFNKKFTARCELKDFAMPSAWKMALVFSINGLVAILLGIGGSTIAVPFLRKARMPMKHAVACTAVVTPIIAIVGCVAYLMSGLNATGLPAYSLGYIYLPAFVGLTLGTIFGVPLGVRLAQKIPDAWISKLYLWVLAVVAIAMVF